jgi:hypothetical protein
MAREGQQSLIEAAQKELMKLKGSGRHLLEAIAEAKDLDASAQQVCSPLWHTSTANKSPCHCVLQQLRTAFR